MKSILRLFAIVVGAVLLIIGGLAAYLALMFDINDYRDHLTAEVRKQTGRDLSIDGRIGLSVFPWLGVEMEDVTLGEAPGWGDEPFAVVRKLEARARFLPLLSGQVDVDRVRVEGLAVRVVKDENGRFNWSDLMEGSEGGTSRDSGPGERRPRQAGTPAAVLALGGLDVVDSSLQWLDRQQGVAHSLTGIELSVDAVRVGEPFEFALGFDARSDAPAMDGRVELAGRVTVQPERQHVAVAGLVMKLDASGVDVPGDRQSVSVRSNLAFDGGAGKLTLSQLVLELAGLKGAGQLEVSGLGDAPRVDGPLAFEAFSPRTVMQALGQAVPATRDPAVLSRASLSMRVDGSAERVMLRELDLRLDDSRLTGELGLLDVSRGALGFDLALDTLDLDRYLPPDTPKAAASPGAAAGAVGRDEPSLNALRELDLDGKLSIAQLTASGLRVSDVRLTARAQGGQLRLSPVNARLYGGSYSGNISLDARRATPRLNLDETLSGLQIAGLLADLTGEEARLTGQGDVRMRLQADGLSDAALRQSLAGTVNLRFADGALKGVNVAQFLREASARLRGQPVPPESGPNQTDFTDLSATLNIASGIVRNDDFVLRSPLLRVGGAGTANLVNEQLDYLVRASLVGSLEGQGGAERDALRGVTVPIRVSGSFDAPRYALDVETLIRENLSERARERVQEKVEERVLERVPAELQDNLRRSLRGLVR